MGTLDRPSSGHGAAHWPRRGRAGRRASSPRLRATRIGFVFQQFFLAEHETVLDNVADGLLYAGVRQAERRQRASTRSTSSASARALRRPAHPAVRRAAPARGHRPGPGRPAGHRARRRAHRQPRPGHRPVHPGPPRPAPRAAASRSSSSPTTAASPTRMPRRVEMLDGRIVSDTPTAATLKPATLNATAPSSHPTSTPDAMCMTATPVVPRRNLRPQTSAGWHVGLRTRKLRAGLSALGIAIGVAAIVAVLGLSASSQAGLLAEIDQLGTNMLTVENGQTLFGQPAELPKTAPAMIGRIAGRHRGPRHRLRHQRRRLPQPAHPVHRHQRPQRPGRQPRPAARHRRHPRAGQLPQRRHRHGAGRRARCPRRPTARDRPRLPRRAHLARQPMVLRRRNPEPGRPRPRASTPPCSSATPPPRPTSAPTVIPPPSTCARRPTRSTRCSRSSRPPPTRRPRARSTSANPPRPSSPGPTPRVPSTACSSASGAVALLVGAVGVANIMIISVLERRSEIGLRRALGATKGHIRVQFLSEAILLATPGRRSRGRPRQRCPPPSTPTPKAGPSSYPSKPGPAASPPPSSSAASPACSPRCAPPACHPPKPSGPCETYGTSAPTLPGILAEPLDSAPAMDCCR